ncbi:MAG: zinc-binding dehydrogenase [Eubacteriales bacterium]
MPKAAVFMGADKPFEVKEYPLTAPSDGMAQLKLKASGICGTDIHIHRGKIPVQSPMIIGHEFVGEVTNISSADSEKYGISVGDNAIVDIACPCGECELCKSGDDANCINMTLTNGGHPDNSPHLVGGFAEYNYSPAANLIKLPAGMDAKMACVFACAGPTSLHAFSLAKRAGVDMSAVKTAVVQGLGPVGMFTVMYLRSLGIKNIIAVTFGKNDKREEQALRLGASEIINLSSTSPEDMIARVRSVGGIGADLVFEASGSPAAFAQGLQMLRNRGVYLVPGQYSNSGMVEIAPQLITFNALHIIGSSQYSMTDVRTYVAFVEARSRASRGHPVPRRLLQGGRYKQGDRGRQKRKQY